MNQLYRYILLMLLCATLGSCSKDESDGETTPEMVEITFDTKSSSEGSNAGDLIGVSLNNYIYNGVYNNKDYYFFGQYIVDTDGSTIVSNGDKFIVSYGSYYVMYSGVKAETERDGKTLTKVPEHELYNDKCAIYEVHRNGEDASGNSDVYIAIPDVTYLYFTGNSLIYDTSSTVTASYILDANIELKQQYSQMKFTLQSNKQDDADASADAGHVITEIGVKNLIDKAKVCAIHGLHVDVESDMAENNIDLIYDNDNDGNVKVTDLKTLTHSDDMTDGYINILSGDYSKLDDVTSEGVLPTPTLYVTYSGGDLPNVTNYLPLMVKLEPQTRYQFDVTLTITQINVTVSEVSGWGDGGEQEHIIKQIGSYSINVNSDSSDDSGWDDDHTIDGSI